MSLERLYTSAEVSELLGIPTATLYAQRYRNEPPGSLAIQVGRYLRWLPSDLESFLASRQKDRRASIRS